MEKISLGRGQVKPFIESMLGNTYFKTHFATLPMENQINLVFQFVTGPQTARFAAEPVYARTGKGRLASKGVPGLMDDRKLLAFLESAEGKRKVRSFSRMVAAELATREG